MTQNCFRRIEKKYLLSRAQYYAMLDGIESHMEPDAYSNYTIQNVYYDTINYDLIRTSLQKPVFKEKLRVRCYGESSENNQVFVELKRKYDGIVYKRRITMDMNDAFDSLNRGYIRREEQISKEINWFLRNYQPQPMAFIGYDREAYAGIGNPDLRLTFDTNLRGRSWNPDFLGGNYGNLIIPEDSVLMEIKIPDSAPVWLARLLSVNGIVSASFSKYGTYYKQLIGAMPVYLENYTGEYIYA